MDSVVVVTVGLTVPAVISGMLGLGVAFPAIPFPGSFAGARITSLYVPRQYD